MTAIKQQQQPNVYSVFFLVVNDFLISVDL